MVVIVQMTMKEHVLTKTSEVDKMLNMKELELGNFDSGALANYFTTDEVNLFHGVICV